MQASTAVLVPQELGVCRDAAKVRAFVDGAPVHGASDQARGPVVALKGSGRRRRSYNPAAPAANDKGLGFPKPLFEWRAWQDSNPRPLGS